MGSTFRMKTGAAVAAWAVAALAALAGCGSTQSGTRAGTGALSTLPASTSSTVGTTPSTVGNTGVPTSTTPPATAAGTSPGAATTTAAPAAAKGCLAGQLAIEIGPANGAAGSVGYTNDFKNVSNTTCTLYGYPGLQMLNASGQPIPTDAIRATSVTVPPVPEKLVTLIPGSKADFDMGFAASTGYGSAQCPTSTRVEFTAPNDFQSLTVTMAIRPYGGPDIDQLHCGQIHISPVYAGS
jgi:hypothetical protein